MSVTVIVGGQYGSEGKGKLAALIATQGKVDLAIRCGGPNAGHTVVRGSERTALRQISTASIIPDVRVLIPAGGCVEPSLLLAEVKAMNLDGSRLGVDGGACIVTDDHKVREEELDLRSRLSSTLSGTGAATASKVLRESTVLLAKDVPELSEFIVDVALEVNEGVDKGQRILVEGTQGFGLSLHHCNAYPFATSRDTSVGSFISEIGISSRLVDKIVMVMRTFPIRVAGNSGPLESETTWEKITKDSGSPVPLSEFTTVTQRLRRVGEFEWESFRRAIMVNRPTDITLTGTDYLSFEDKGKHRYSDLTEKTRSFVEHVEKIGGVPVSYIFTGPDLDDVIDRT